MDKTNEFCINHPDRLAVALCAECGRPFCSECLTDVEGFPYCPVCVDDARERNENVDDESLDEEEQEEETRPIRRHRVRDALIGLFLTGLILVLTFCVTFNNGVVFRIFSQPYVLLSLPRMTDSEPGPLRTRETAHFIIYHRNDNLADWLAKATEEDLARTAADVGANVPTLMSKGKYKVVIAKDPTEYRALAPSTPSTTSDGTTNRETRTVIINQTKTSYMLHVALAHEISHLVYSDILDRAYYIPLWVIEGFANVEQAKVDDIIFQNQKELVLSNLGKGTLIPLSDMTFYPTGQEERELFYAQSASVSAFLIDKYGMKKFIEFSRELESGKDTDAAIKNIYNPLLRSLNDLETKWIASLR